MPTTTPRSSDDKSWVRRFNRLAVSDPPPAPSPVTNYNPYQPSRSQFVGGFAGQRDKPLPTPPPPPPIGGGFYTSHPAAIPPPPAILNFAAGNGPRMPEPQSLTMQYAIAGGPVAGTSSPLPPPTMPSPPVGRPHSASEIPRPAPAPAPVSVENANAKTQRPATPPRPKPAANSPSPAAPSLSPRANSDSTVVSTPPKRRGRRSSVASPGTPGDGNAKVQCSGQKISGERCGRFVKADASTGGSDDDPEDAARPIYCHQHRKSMVAPTTFFARKNGREVKFADWIPTYLHPDTQIALRGEMEKTRSASEEDGYIYAFQILDPDDPNTVHMKVGRTTKLTQRIHQWGKQCGSKEQVLRGFWPFPSTVEGEDDDVGASLLKGRVQPGNPGPNSHRLERLIHLELADLVANSPYQDAGWKDMGNGEEGTVSPPRNIKSKCPDCGTMHKEIFSLSRIKAGKNRRKEWDAVVQPVIERWGRFVELYV